MRATDARASHPGWSQRAELVYLLVRKDLGVRYKSSLLGYLWALANPLCYTLVYYVTFKVIMHSPVPDFALYLVTGLYPWNWTASTLIQGANAYRTNETLVRKVKLPLPIIPFGIALQEAVHFVFAFPVLLGALWLADAGWHLSWLVLIPLMLVVHMAIIYPMSLVLASANVLVRDVEYLIAIVLQMLFFLTPIVYTVEQTPANLRPWLELNPFVPLLIAWRTVLFHGALGPEVFGRCVMLAAISSLAAVAVHRAVGWRVGELL
jgi:lipopolysaccharide transport system permease protein